MKKLLAMILALLMVVPLFVIASATETDDAKSFSVYTANSTELYYSNSQITIVLSVRDIDFGADDGISALEFDLFYDKDKVSPVTSASEDADGDAGDFSALMTTKPGSWEGFGVLKSDEGIYNLAFSDIESADIIKEDDELVIEIPFLVNNGVRLDDIVFDFDRVIAYNSNMEYMVELDLESIIVQYSVQPAQLETLPDDAINLQVAGYSSDSNVIYYAENDITIGGFVSNYCEITANEDKMSSFAIMVVDMKGIVTYVNTDVSSENDKSSVVIPAGSYVIGVCNGNDSDYQKMLSSVEVGKRITLYNVNIESVGNSNKPIQLTDAGFAVSDASENQPPFVGGDIPETEIMVGDINGNGEIDIMDYSLVKRAYFGKFEVSDIRVADVNKSGSIDAFDYVIIKRVYFGNYEI